MHMERWREKKKTCSVGGKFFKKLTEKENNIVTLNEYANNLIVCK